MSAPKFDDDRFKIVDEIAERTGAEPGEVFDLLQEEAGRALEHPDVQRIIEDAAEERARALVEGRR